MRTNVTTCMYVAHTLQRHLVQGLLYNNCLITRITKVKYQNSAYMEGAYRIVK